jgi:hypothetical protein
VCAPFGTVDEDHIDVAVPTSEVGLVLQDGAGGRPSPGDEARILQAVKILWEQLLASPAVTQLVADVSTALGSVPFNEWTRSSVSSRGKVCLSDCAGPPP